MATQEEAFLNVFIGSLPRAVAMSSQKGGRPGTWILKAGSHQD
jgi:hypothetical protein